MFIQGLLLPLVMTKQINHFNELNVLATLAGLIILACQRQNRCIARYSHCLSPQKLMSS